MITPPGASRRALARRCCARLLMLILLLAGPAATTIQASPGGHAAAPPLTHYLHDAWGLAEGLPVEALMAVVQTRDGYLWLGTQEGLVRFDGVRFTTFNKANLEGLASSRILALLEDRAGALWIGTHGGGLSRLQDGRLTTYRAEGHLSSDNVSSLLEDRAGNLWIGTIGGGLTRFDGRTFTHYGTQDGLPSNIVLALTEDRAGRLWIGTYDGGLSRFENGRFTSFGGEHGLHGRTIRALRVDRQGTLWVGTEDGLARRDGERFTTYRPADGLSGSAVTAIEEDPAGALWIGTLNGGLSRLDGGFSAFTTAEGLTHDAVRGLFHDREGSLWIATEGGGLNRLRLGAFQTLTTRDGLASNFVIAVLEDRAGALWVGTEGSGLSRIDRHGRATQFSKAQGLASDHVYALHEDRAGRLWAGLIYEGGLCRLDGNRFTCFGLEDGLTNENVYALAEDRHGALWIGTDRGLHRYRDGRITRFAGDSVLASVPITAIHEDRSGALWVGTYGSGLGRIRGTGVQHYGENAGLASRIVLALHEDTEGTLWIGTAGDGLCRFRQERLTCFGTEEGFFNENVLQILEDESGYLWLGTLQGIARIHKSALNDFAEGRSRILPTRTFDLGDGLRSREMRGGAQSVAWRARDGRLLFASVNGLAVTNPADLRLNTAPPPMALEALLVNGTPVPLDAGAILLPPGSRDLRFDFTALSFIKPDQVRFVYRLEGYDKEWHDAGNRREVSYTNLPPRAYRFVVKAANSDGAWNETGVALPFSVAPFFYQTLWFYVLCGLLLLLGAVGTYRLRVRHLKHRERELTQLVREQTRELLEREEALKALNANLAAEVQRQLELILVERRRYEHELITAKDKAEASDRLKSTILMNMSHELRTPVAAIMGFSHILSEEVPEEQREFASYIHQNGVRLQNTINAILELSHLEADGADLRPDLFDLAEAATAVAKAQQPTAERKALHLYVEAPAEPLPVYLDRTAVERALQHLVDNALKFTQAGAVTVSVGTTPEHVFLCVQDTGIGIGKDFLPYLFEAFKQESDGLTRDYEGSGLGLTVTQRLVDAMGGTIHVWSEKGRGSVFTVLFPLAVLQEQATSSLTPA